MRILVVCQHYYPEPFRSTDICEELVKRGNSVTALVGLPNYPEGKVLREYKKKKHRIENINGVDIIRCYEHGRGHNYIDLIWNYFSYAISGKRKVKIIGGEFDVVLVLQLTPVMMAWPGIKYAKVYKKPVILYCYDLWPASLTAGGIKESSLIYKFFKRISKRVYDSCDKICVTSQSFLDYFKIVHNVSETKLSFLPQYCEDLFENVVSKERGDFNFVFAGNIGKMQSVETIIRAAEVVKNKGRADIKIHIIGDGRDYENCQKLSNDLQTDNVVFYGRRPVSEMEFFYSFADAMIVTLAKNDLISKTLPGKVQSFMAAGKPMLASIDGEAAMTINAAKCGLVCGAEDYIGLANLFLTFSKEDGRLMGRNSRQYYEKHFTKELFFKKLFTCIDSVCNNEQ